MHRFFAQRTLEVGTTVQLNEKEALHAYRVLRLTVGTQVEITDADSGSRYLAELTQVDSEAVYAKLLKEIPQNEAPVEITLFMGIPKADKLDLVVQKITELGAVRLIPVRMERSVAKIDAKDAGRKAERMRKIAAEAVKQCGRAVTPEICEAMDFKPAAKLFSENDLSLVPWEEADGINMKAMYRQNPDVKRIGLWVGPEGGISAGEIEKLKEYHAQPITLGPRILRTETAAIVSVASAMQLWGDL